MANTDIIIHDEKDNVGVVVIEKIIPNQDCDCWVMENDSSIKIQSKNEIPLGHKIAMVDFSEGDTIIKYGHDIVFVYRNVFPSRNTLSSWGIFGLRCTIFNVRPLQPMP